MSPRHELLRAEVLRPQARDIGPIAAGKVGLAKSAWKRVLAALRTVA